jgi:hypothetical protein
MVLAGFLAAFCYAGLPLLAHVRRIGEPSTQTSAGVFHDGTLTVDGDAITVAAPDGALVMSRAEVADGWIEPTLRGGHRVVVRHRSGDLGVVEVPSRAAGQELLAAVGLSADRHALRVQTSGNAGQTVREMAFLTGMFSLVVPLFVVGAADGAREIGAGLVWLAVCATVTAALGAATVKPVVRVGLDGIEITRGRSRRFVPVRDVASVEMTLDGVALSVRGAPRRLVLRTWGVQQAALLARIQEVVRGFGAASASAAALAQLDRQGRELARWRDDLRRLASDDAGGYRRVALSREDLGRLLVQGDASAERRIGAALALAASGVPAERERVRIAARAAANEELRAALEAIAEDELDAAERAVVSLTRGARPPAA